MLFLRNLSVAALALFLVCGCSADQWQPLAETVCLKQEELLPLLEKIRNEEDLCKNVVKVEAWSKDFNTTLIDFCKQSSHLEIAPADLDLFKARFSITFSGLKKEVSRITSIGAENLDQDHQDARNVIVARCNTGINPFTKNFMSAGARLASEFDLNE